jgi:hypothetical protein
VLSVLFIPKNIEKEEVLEMRLLVIRYCSDFHLSNSIVLNIETIIRKTNPKKDKIIKVKIKSKGNEEIRFKDKGINAQAIPNITSEMEMMPNL